MRRSKNVISFILVAVLIFTSYSIYSAVYVDAAQETLIKEYTFDDTTEGWTARGSETVDLSTEVGHNSVGALQVTNRTSTWQGASCDITNLLEDGKTYTFRMWVFFNEETAPSQQNMTMSVAYTTMGTSESYQNIASVPVTKGQWTLVEGNYTYNDTIEKLKVYVEGGTMDFYVDDASISLVADIEIEQDLPSLKDSYSDYFKIGTAVTASSLTASEKEMIKKHFNSITCGNEMKPDAVLDYNATIAYMEETGDQTSPQINLSQAASILKFAAQYKIPMRGHTLVWHNQTPRWFFAENYSKESEAPLVSKEVMLKRLENYIKNVFETLEKEYPTIEFYTWDVVNEAVDPSQSNGLRAPSYGLSSDSSSSSLWMGVIGEEFIERAFEYARKYAPEGTLLAYNDYNECETQKSEYIYNICKKLIEQGNLDVIGMQQHNNMNTPSASEFETAIRKYASLGAKIEITEMDITTTDSSDSGFKKQGEQYEAFFNVMRKVKEEGIDINAAVVWGVRDSESWRSSQYPLLFDANYKAKPAFWGVLGDLYSVTSTPVVTTAPTEQPEKTITPTQNPEETTTPIPDREYLPVVTVSSSVGGSVTQQYAVQNGGTSPIDLSGLELRCYYQKEGTIQDNFTCTHAGITLSEAPWYIDYTENVIGTFEKDCLTIILHSSNELKDEKEKLSFGCIWHQNNWVNYDKFNLLKVEVYFNGKYIGLATIK